MTAKSNHDVIKVTSVACPSCGFPNAIREPGTYLQYCQNDPMDSDIAYQWQRKQYPDKEPTACNAQFFVDAHLQIVARVSSVQWSAFLKDAIAYIKDEKETTMLSLCCGAEEHPDAEGFCGACNEATGFEEGEG